MRMRRRTTALVLSVVTAALSLATLVDSAVARPEHAKSPIKHVVIVFQENHTFDDVLGQVCQSRVSPCDGYTGPVKLADGVTAANVVEPDVVPYVKHNPPSQQLGLADRWDQIDGCTRSPYLCVSHVNPARIPNLATLADTFAVSDATFAEGKSASFGAHVSLVAGTRNGFLGFNPVKSKTGHKVGPGWGCPSFRDALWGTASDHQYAPSCIPDAAGKGPYRASPVPYHVTVMQRMEQAGLTWHTYQGDADEAPADTSFSFCTYFAWCLDNRFNTKYDSAFSDFVAAAKRGTLPNLSILIPMGGVSQHNGTSMAKGDNYIGQIVSSLEKSPEWDSTAVFITYDDCGCFFDHVTPPAGLGLRNPMVIVSPFAKSGFTDSKVAVQPYSMLAFVQHTFGLAPLTSAVSGAYDYGDSFDFRQQPLSGPAMTRQSIPAWERREVARLAPRVARDPA